MSQLARSVKKNLYKRIFLFLECFAVIVDCQTAQHPQNTAVVAGSSLTRLECSDATAPTNMFTWHFYPLGSEKGTAIANNCLTEEPSTHYTVDNSTSNACGLLIHNANSNVAGAYQCVPGFGDGHYANFIVLEDDPVCSTTPTDTIPIYQSVVVTCGTTVYGNIKPVMTWQDIAGNPYTNGSGYVGATASITASIPTVPSYTCNTAFNAPPFQENYATNTPSYTSECNSSSVDVLYLLSNVTIKLNGNSDNVACGDTLTCSASGNPPPTYSWSGSATGNEDTVTISTEGKNTYNCTAENSQGSTQTTITVTVPACSSDNFAQVSTTTSAVVSDVADSYSSYSFRLLLQCFVVACVNLYLQQ